MGTKVTISDFDSVDNSSFITELNNAKDELADEFDSVLYRDGSFNMLGDLDMDSNRIYNLPAPVNGTEPLRLIDAAALSGIEQPDFSFAVNTLAAGEDATIGVTGTYPNLLVTFGIPEGEAGSSGALSDGTYGGIVVSGSGANLNVIAEHITLARMAQLPANTIIGNDTGSPAVPQALSIAEVQAMVGANLALTGTSTAVTPAASDNDTSIATTAFVHNVLASDMTRTIPILATSMTARGTSGPGNSSSETGTNKLNFITHDFDATSPEYVQVPIPMPKGWNEGTVTVQFIWRVNSGTGSVVWGARAVSLSDDDILDAAFGAAVTVTDAVTATGDLMISGFTGAMTIGGTPAAEDLVMFEFYRDASNGSDTLATDARLIAVRVKYTTAAKDDS